MDMTLHEFKIFTCNSWIEKYQPLTFDMTTDRYTGRYRLGLNSIFVPNSSPFFNQMSIFSKITEQHLINLSKLAEQQKEHRYLKLKTEF